MALAALSENDRQIILQSMKVISDGRFLEGEFHTRLGIEPEELRQVIEAYPHIDDTDDNSNATLAINNCLNEVCHGIRFSDREWSRWFTASKSEVEEVYQKWAILRGWLQTGIR